MLPVKKTAMTKHLNKIKDRMMERTFAMIKPDVVAAKNSGKVIDIIEQNGFTIVGMEKTQLSKQKAELFYAVHNRVKEAHPSRCAAL